MSNRNRNREIKTITVRELELKGACKDGMLWFKNNIGSLDVDKLDSIKDIKGDYNNYIKWLRDNFIPKIISTYDDNGNQLTSKHPDGYSWTKTYDEKGNELTFKDSDGYSWTKTYDDNANELTFKNSYGYSWTKTYDDRGNELTSKDSDGDGWSKTYDDNDNELTYEKSNGYKWTRTYTRTDKEFIQTFNGEVEVHIIF